MDDLTFEEITELFYLALALWREARGESVEGRIAVACSIRNRVERPSWWGTTFDQVVTKKWQYSSLTDPHDPQLAKWPLISDLTWIECLKISKAVLDNETVNPVPGADSYHDVSIAPPAWTKTARKCGQIGKLLFYDVDLDFQGDTG